MKESCSKNSANTTLVSLTSKRFSISIAKRKKSLFNNVPRSEKYDKFYLDKSWKSAASSLFGFTVDSVEQRCSAIGMLSNSIRLDSFCLNS